MSVNSIEYMELMLTTFLQLEKYRESKLIIFLS
jgi:hypothetical protein